MLRVAKPAGFGNIILEEAPIPECGPREVLVKNQVSLISRGSEVLRRYMHEEAIDPAIMGYSVGGVVAAVALVDVLDHLLPAIGLDVEIDVGRTVALGREEPLEQQPEVDRIGLGDPEGVAHRAVRRAPPPLAVDVLVAAELDDVPHDEEVAGEAEVLDDVELVVDGAPGASAQARDFIAGNPPTTRRRSD